MDPNQMLRDMMDLVVELGQGDTKYANLHKLTQIVEKAEGLNEWLSTGGFAPTVKFVVMEDKA